MAMSLAACGKDRDKAAAPSDAPVADTAPVTAPTNPVVGGATMTPTRTIADNIAAAPALSTLANVLRTAEMTATLAGPGPFTVFAPNDAAFARLAPGVQDQLLLPANRASLAKLLRYHIVAGNLTAQELTARITAGGGTATLTTLAGDPLTATMTQSVITLTDVNGNKSYVEVADARQSNGLVHVVNGVLVPNLG
ncbi:fasciclin domain-containing protein [uncultured Sphingomonas sp.]|uniref:fasciclin domain-containing protein n=1 Tax=uncultured Sphingomonas sp. TaxID=158754 RepID=UPI00262E1F8E|nr:fasciclin domain-containing protein [uncultured Sphingomonas sp.]